MARLSGPQPAPESSRWSGPGSARPPLTATSPHGDRPPLTAPAPAPLPAPPRARPRPAHASRRAARGRAAAKWRRKRRGGKRGKRFLPHPGRFLRRLRIRGTGQCSAVGTALRCPPRLPPPLRPYVSVLWGGWPRSGAGGGLVSAPGTAAGPDASLGMGGRGLASFREPGRVCRHGSAPGSAGNTCLFGNSARGDKGTRTVSYRTCLGEPGNPWRGNKQCWKSR